MPRLLLERMYWVGDEEAEDGEVEGWIGPPLDPTPPLPDFSFRMSSSRLSLLPWPLFISMPCWEEMVYTRVHSNDVFWSSSAAKLCSSERQVGLVETVMDG